MRNPLHRALVPLMAALVSVATLGCGTASDSNEVVGGSTSTEPIATAVAPTTAVSATDAPATSTTATSTTATSTTATSTTVPSTTLPTTTTLAGEPASDSPPSGTLLAVVGVPYDEELNLRVGPGVDKPIVRSLGPLERGLVATGRAQDFAGFRWVELKVGQTVGWAVTRYLAQLGDTTDTTAAIVERLGGVPKAETMSELGRVIASSRASMDPPPRVVMTVGPSVGDLGEVTFDVVGIADDSVLGFRLHIFATPHPDGKAVVLRTVERTLLCRRAVTSEGLCL